MRKTKIGLSVAACLAASVAIAPAAFGQATVIYDNTANRLGPRTSPQNAELGDIVIFAPGTAADRILTEFAFEYFMTPGSGNETVQVFLRSVQDGINPDAIIYQTPAFSITAGTAGGFNTVKLDGLSTFLPETVAWTVKFAGFEGTEEAGLLYANPPTVGSSATFNGGQFIISRNADNSFNILDTPGIAGDNLIARFSAVPEPSTWALILGGLAGFGFLRRRKA